LEKESKSTSSSGLSDMASSKANESPRASPRSTPAEKDDLFSSPSPRRVSATRSRRVSPGNLQSSVRTSHSPTPSPPRSFQQHSPVRPSPLRPALGLSIPAHRRDNSTTPTPTKSSITPSRRLRGPRDLSGESPTKQSKTVTFQSVADVREFEILSIEGSADGSFEADMEEGEEWIDEGAREDSLDKILGEGMTRESSMDSLDQTSDINHAIHDESATADFFNTLIEEGLFSPPPVATPVFQDQPSFAMPGEDDRSAPFLSTPSLGDSIHGTPMMGNLSLDDNTDQRGIPYGRTHHAERAVLAHSLPPLEKVVALEQPDLPHQSDHRMLLNANAAQPGIPHNQVTIGPRSTQDGPMFDPFITIQTTTKIVTRTTEREEAGIPLGRTSHSERVQAAKLLATSSLGLGMPRSPAISNGLAKSQGSPVNLAEYDGESESGSEQEEEAETNDERMDLEYRLGEPVIAGGGREMLFDASFEMVDDDASDLPPFEARVVSEVPEMVGPSSRMTQWRTQKDDGGSQKRGLPKPPRPEPVGIPSPVTSPVKEDAVVEKRVSAVRYRSREADVLVEQV
jgi:serine/arginine repetitive matrix protein 2